MPITSPVGVWPHLLHAHPLEGREAARRQLVAVVPDAQLPVPVIAPAVNLEYTQTTSRFRFFLRVGELGCLDSTPQSHLSVVNQRHGRGLSACDADRRLALQAAGDLPGAGLVGGGARANLATVVITPRKDLERGGGQ